MFILFAFDTAGVLSRQSLLRAPFTSPGNEETKSKLSNLLPKTNPEQIKRLHQRDRRAREMVSLFDRVAHRKKGG